MQQKILRTLFIHIFLWRDLIGINTNHSSFYCNDGEKVSIMDYCDLVPDCEDMTDEKACEYEALLMYDTSSSEQYFNFTSLNFIFLGEQLEFAIRITGSNQSISAAFSYRYRIYYVIDMTFPNGSRSSSIRMTTRLSSILLPHKKLMEYNGEVRIRDLAMDYNTTTTICYMIIDNFGVGLSRIQACDCSTQIGKMSMCTFLRGDLMKRPIRLSISPKHRLLFWIEQKSTSDFSIVKSFMSGDSASEILTHLTSPSYLTLDTQQERLYWLDGDQAHSADFDGTEKNMIVKFTEHVPSFGVYNDTLYWIYPKQKGLFNCNRANCIHPFSYKNVSKDYPAAVVGISKAFNEETLNHMNKSCANMMCSDICLSTSETDYSCICRTSDGIRQEGTLSVNSQFCEDTTLLATNGAVFFIIGDIYSETPQVQHQLGLSDIHSISAFSYNSMNGTIIFSPLGLQKIYVFNPGNRMTTLLLSVGDAGTINALEYDDFGNNIYWIEPTNYSVKVTSLSTLFTTTLWQGNSTYIPLNIALAPNKGFMFLAYVINSLTLVIERHMMDGSQNNMKILLKDGINVRKIVLHYARNTDILFVANEFSDTIGSFEESTDPRIPRYKMKLYTHTTKKTVVPESITSFGNEIIWADSRNSICKFNSTTNSPSCIEHYLFLGSRQLIITSVWKTTDTKSPCHKANGGCSHLCLSSYSRAFTCACADNFTLTQSSMCVVIPAKSNNSSHLARWLFIILGCGLAAALILYVYRIYTHKMLPPFTMRELRERII